MKLEEAIAREEEIHKNNKIVVETHIIHDDLTLEDLYCDDTEVVEEHLENYRFASEYHKQIAEWLEELKEARKGFNENRKAGYKHGYSDGYAKAIDEFAEEVRKAYTSMKSVSDVERSTANTIVLGIAEKLKGGAK